MGWILWGPIVTRLCYQRVILRVTELAECSQSQKRCEIGALSGLKGTRLRPHLMPLGVNLVLDASAWVPCLRYGPLLVAHS